VKYTIRTQDPRSHIEACSIIDYFRCKIVEEKLGTSDDEFYGEFTLEGDENSFEIFSALTGMSAFMDPTNTIR